MKEHQTHFRPERENDQSAIEKLVYKAFTNHPQHAPGALPVEHNVIENLRVAGALTLSLVAEEEGQIVGHIAFSEVLINDQHVN